MTDFTQIPGELNITATHGDDFEFNLNFDISLTGYTFSAKVVKASSNALVPLTVTNVNLALGQIKISLSKTVLATLPTATHRWYMEWTVGGATRRVLAGLFKVVDYP